MLPEPLPDEKDDPDIEPDVENEDDPLDLFPDEEPLLDEPLLDPDMDPDPEPEPDPLPEPEPDPDDARPEPELWAVAGMSLWTHTPSARSVFVPGIWMATVRSARRYGRPIRLLLVHVLVNQEVAGPDELSGREAPFVAATDHERVLWRRLQSAVAVPLAVELEALTVREHHNTDRPPLVLADDRGAGRASVAQLVAKTKRSAIRRVAGYCNSGGTLW